MIYLFLYTCVHFHCNWWCFYYLIIHIVIWYIMLVGHIFWRMSFCSINIFFFHQVSIGNVCSVLGCTHLLHLSCVKLYMMMLYVVMRYQLGLNWHFTKVLLWGKMSVCTALLGQRWAVHLYVLLYASYLFRGFFSTWLFLHLFKRELF